VSSIVARLTLGRPHQLLAAIVVLLASVRLGLYSLFDKRPRFADAETSDLNALFENHIIMRGYSGGGLADFLQLAQFKPPLWYAGFAALFAPAETLHYGPLLATNIAALGIAFWTAWDLGRRSRGPRAALLAVLMVAILPGIAGRVTLLGVEPWHMALLGLYLRGLLVVRERDATRRQAVGLGVIVAVGMLMKWNFVAPLLGPALLEGVAALRARGDGTSWRNRLLLAGTVSAILFGAWFVPLADPTFIAAVAVSESSGDLLGVAAVAELGFYWLSGMGVTGCLLTVLAALRVFPRAAADGGATPRTGTSVEMLLLASIVSLLLVHWLIPHKDLRYLLPAFWAAGVLIALRLDLVWDQSRLDRTFIAAAILGSVLTTFVFPTIPRPHSGPGDTETYINWFGEANSANLRFEIQRSDNGIRDLVDLEQPSGAPPLWVASSLSGPRRAELLTMLTWEFYTHNEGPVLSLSSFATLNEPEARVALNSATHFITHRQLSTAELKQLEHQGFELMEERRLDGTTAEVPTVWFLWQAKKDKHKSPATGPVDQQMQLLRDLVPTGSSD